MLGAIIGDTVGSIYELHHILQEMRMRFVYPLAERKKSCKFAVDVFLGVDRNRDVIG